MPLVDETFEDTFEFSRARAADYREADGEIVEAPIDVPRFDHSEAGVPRGLLVDVTEDFTLPDVLRVRDGDWAEPPGTLLHEYEDQDGLIQNRAWYVYTDPLGVANVCLDLQARHRRIAFVPVLLPNRGGHVRWRSALWTLGSILITETAVAIGATADQPLLEG